MGEPRPNVSTTSSAHVWVRRCRACRAVDLSAAFGQRRMLTELWSCPRCRAGRFEPVQLPLPSADSLLRCPHLGAA